MTSTHHIIADEPELIMEATALSEDLSQRATTTLVKTPLEEALRYLQDEAKSGASIGILCTAEPTFPQMVALGLARRRKDAQIALTLCLPSEADADRWAGLACDLGLVGTATVPGAIAALALLSAGGHNAHLAQLKPLPPADRARLRSVCTPKKGNGQLERGGPLRFLYTGAGKDASPVLVGTMQALIDALRALRRRVGASPQATAKVDGVDLQAVLDVILGPSRALSDPASKAALSPFGVPIPEEELCTSASRAAAEAQRLGFPVRIALASPDLRIWDHPELVVDGVDNAARVREVFRQLMQLGEQRADRARVLGVSVSADAPAQAELFAHFGPVHEGLVQVSLGFADRHGKASDDRLLTVLPAPMARFESVLGRLRGFPLLGLGSAQDARARVQAIGDVLLRLAAFSLQFRDEVEGIEVRPLSLRWNGEVEIREACVHVSRAFERAMEKDAPLH